MNPLVVVSGTIIETQRFINVPLRMWERYLARERREVWLREADEQERKWVIHTRVLPARRGHRVVLLLEGDWVVGLFNATTGADVNYPRTDPPFLLRGFDVLAGLALAVGLPSWLRDASFVLLPLAVTLYMILAVCARSLSRWRLRRQVDKTLAELRMASENPSAASALSVGRRSRMKVKPPPGRSVTAGGRRGRRVGEVCAPDRSSFISIAGPLNDSAHASRSTGRCRPKTRPPIGG